VVAIYLKMRIEILEFEIAMLEARMLEQNSDVLKSNKCGLETRSIVIQLYYSQVVNDIAEDLKVVFDKAGPAKLSADFQKLRKSALVAKARKIPESKSIEELLFVTSLELDLLRGSFGNSQNSLGYTEENSQLSSAWTCVISI
jgi:hypothetical protein